MATYYLHADAFFFPSEVKHGGYLEVIDGKFGRYVKEQPSGDIKEFPGQWIAPGFVDTHIHGYMGHDVMDNDVEGIKEMSKGLLSCGVTSFLPTTLTDDVERLDAVCKTISSHADEVEGAKIAGIYFEGPFFTEEHKGAQNPKYFHDPDIAVFARWQESANGLIKKIALAPEREGAAAFIQQVTQLGVKVALGHSAATYEQAMTAVDAGASVFVHTYNGMSGLNHREPGMVGAAMASEETFAELICDGHHVHPAAVKALVDQKHPNRVALITDCMRAGGMPDGHYTLGEFPVTVANGAARLTEGNSLAGSILHLIDGAKNVVNWQVATAAEAIKMASETPAVSCGIDDVCGAIRPGREADFVVLTPQMELAATYVDGIEKFVK